MKNAQLILTQGSLTPRQRTMAKGLPTLPHFVPPKSMPIFQKQTAFLLPLEEMMYFLWNNKPRCAPTSPRHHPLMATLKKLTLSWLNPKHKQQLHQMDDTDCPE